MHPKNSIRLLAAALLAAATQASATEPGAHTATVLETMDSGGYTYLKVQEGDATYWAAGPATKVTVGDQVSFTEQMMMDNFTSRTLNRTFDHLMFVSGVKGGSAAPGTASPERAALSGPIAKPEGGYTVAEIFAQRDGLKGQTVKVRGKVVKVSEGIMGKNWVHLQDGTGAEGSNNLIFRSETNLAEVGSVVTAEGVVDTDKDFGYGYQYPVLVEGSTFTE